MTETVWELFDLEDNVAVVTGATGQLGPQLCDALAEAGAHVVVASRTFEDCEELADSISQDHAEAMPVAVDVTDEDSIDEMVASVVDRFGRIDVLVNNAYCGSGHGKSFENLSREEWTSMLEGTVTQTFLCSQAALPALRQGDRGVIVNLGSIYGVVAPDQGIYGDADINNPPNYGAGKAGVIQFTKWLATYLAADGIRVNAISPGGFYSEDMEDIEDYNDVFVPNYERRTPLGRMGNDTDLKGAIVFLASEASNWMTGQNMIIDGGWTTW